MKLKFILPLPPSVNEQYTQRAGRRVLSKTAQHYKQALLKELRRLRAQGSFGGLAPPPDEDEADGETGHEARNTGHKLAVLQPCSLAASSYIALRLTFYFKNSLRRDLDNGLKVTQDILCTGLGINDNRVVQVFLEKRVDKKNPRLEVVLEPLGYWEFEQEQSLFKEETPIDREFDLLRAVKPTPTKSKGKSAPALSSLEELAKKFGWQEE